jgi:hypothetical protein
METKDFDARAATKRDRADPRRRHGHCVVKSASTAHVVALQHDVPLHELVPHGSTVHD